jgi:hypothetical protein
MCSAPGSGPSWHGSGRTVVGGADLVRQLLSAGLVDELRIDGLPRDRVRLEKLGVEEAGPRTSLNFRVLQ